jgi:hypothetical protein
VSETAPQHPLLKWLRDNKVTYRMASARARRAGVGTSPKYIEQIAIGWCRPGIDVARYISERLTHGEIALGELLSFNYRRPPNKKAVA